jgi:outer membrane protein OmpA-like peptidoglycan-associated protein
VLAALRAALATLPAAEVIVTGHTDRVGSVEANDRLSLARAQAVRELLVDAGVARSIISVVGRGERAPLVPTADEVAEARNRRVEIKIR